MGESKKISEEILVDFLDCPCKVFQPMKNEEVLMKAYVEAQSRGKREGFVPVLVCCDDIENLLESLIWNSDGKQYNHEEYQFDRTVVRAFREELCKKELPDGKAVLEKWKKGLKEYIEEQDWDDEDEYEDDDEYDEDEYEDNDEYDDDDEYDEDDYINTSLCAYHSYTSDKTTTVILAEIPVVHPWEIFAWLPFGGWNECPDAEDMMAISKYWYETYGAVPATVSHDVLEYMLSEPVNKEDTKNLAWDMVAFCSDVISQGDIDIKIFADSLTESTVWFFWWD